MKSILMTLVLIALLSICQAAEPQLHTFIKRGDDKIEYSGGKNGLRAILLSFLKIKSENEIRIHSELNKAVAVKGKHIDFEIKSRTYSFEVINGYHRFTVLPDDPEEEIYAITANESFEGAVAEFVESLYKMTK